MEGPWSSLQPSLPLTPPSFPPSLPFLPPGLEPKNDQEEYEEALRRGGGRAKADLCDEARAVHGVFEGGEAG